MSFVKLPHCSHDFEPPRQRPSFNHQNTLDRLREAELRRPSMISNIKKNRKSVFKEVGLDLEDERATVRVIGESAVMSDEMRSGGTDQQQQHQQLGLAPLDTRSAAERGGTTDRAHETEADHSPESLQASEQEFADDRAAPPGSETSASPQSPTTKTPWYAKLATGRRPRVRAGSNAPPTPFQGLSTITMLALAVAVMAPVYTRSGQDTAGIVDAGPIVKREKSPTDVCARWAQQSKWAFLLLRDYNHGDGVETSLS